MRTMKFHIINTDGDGSYPLCWDNKAIEFDTKEAAEFFITKSKEVVNGADDNFFNKSEIKEEILYYDGGYIRGEDIVLSEEDIACCDEL